VHDIFVFSFGQRTANSRPDDPPQHAATGTAKQQKAGAGYDPGRPPLDAQRDSGSFADKRQRHRHRRRVVGAIVTKTRTGESGDRAIFTAATATKDRHDQHVWQWFRTKAERIRARSTRSATWIGVGGSG